MGNEARLLERHAELQPSADLSLFKDVAFVFIWEKLLSKHVLSNCWRGVEAIILNMAF